jgi:hypothetical protein
VSADATLPLQQTSVSPLIWRLLVTLLCVASISLAIHYRNASALRPTSSRISDAEAISEYLRRSPFDAAAHLALAHLTTRDAAFSQSISDAAMQSAIRLAPHDPQTIRLLAYRAFRAGDAVLALDWVERLAALGGDDLTDAFSTMDSVAATPAWEQRLIAWQSSKNGLLKGYAATHCIGTAELESKIWVATRAASVGMLAPSTVDCLAQHAAAKPAIVDVYSLWLDAMSNPTDSRTYVSDGGFDARDRSGPFTWKIGTGGEFRDGFVTRVATEKTEAIPNRFFQVEFNGKPVRTNPLSQLLVLPAGNYSLSFKYRDTASTPTSTLGILIDCASDGARLAEPNTASTSQETLRGWRERRVSFRVPEKCYAQRLQLESTYRGWKTNGVNGRIALDDVVITRTEN